MAGKRKVTVEISGDSSHLSKALHSTSSKMGKWGHSISKGAVVAAGALAAGAATAGYALVGMVKNAAKDEAAQRRLAKALHNTTGARKADIDGVEKWISQVSLAKGIADDQLRPALQRLAQSSGDIGKAQQDLAVAMDGAQGSGKSLEVVATAMSKAQNGNMGALSKLGVRIKDVHGKTLSYRDAVKGMAETFKGQATAAAESFDGKIGRLRIAFDEAKETIGAKFIPILTKLADWVLKTAIPMFDKWAPKILGLFHRGGAAGEYFGGIIDGIKDAIKGVKEKFEEYRPQLEVFFTRMMIIGKALAKVMGTYLKWAFKILGKAIEVVIVVIAKLVEWTPTILKDFIRPVVLGFISMAQLIVTSAAIAFGWIPGIGDKLQRARKAIDEFKAKTDRQFKTWAENLSKQGEKGGANLARGLARGIRRNSHLPKAEAARVAAQVGRQAGVANGPNIPAYAAGTRSARRGIALVGENGPELVRMRGGEQVIPAGSLSGSGIGTTYLDFRGAVIGRGADVAIVNAVRSYVRERGGNVQVLAGSRA